MPRSVIHRNLKVCSQFYWTTNVALATIKIWWSFKIMWKRFSGLRTMHTVIKFPQFSSASDKSNVYPYFNWGYPYHFFIVNQQEAYIKIISWTQHILFLMKYNSLTFSKPSFLFSDCGGKICYHASHLREYPRPCSCICRGLAHGETCETSKILLHSAFLSKTILKRYKFLFVQKLLWDSLPQKSSKSYRIDMLRPQIFIEMLKKAYFLLSDQYNDLKYIPLKAVQKIFHYL